MKSIKFNFAHPFVGRARLIQSTDNKAQRIKISYPCVDCLVSRDLKEKKDFEREMIESEINPEDDKNSDRPLNL